MNRAAWLAILLLWIILGLWFSDKYLCNPGQANTDPSSGIIGADRDYNDDITRSGIGGPLVFSKSSYDRPIASAALESSISDLAKRLQDNPSETAIITGCYGVDEQNTSTFDDLGMARAHSIQSWLMDNGVSPDQVELRSTICDDTAWDGDQLSNAIQISYGEVLAKASTKTPVVSEFGNDSAPNCADKIVLNYRYNREKINLTSGQRACLDDMLYQLDQNGGMLDITGHTDDEEYDEAELSLLRANRIKNFLVQKMNANPGSITTNGYGTGRSIAENCSISGRAQNRRVEISIR